jgi:translation initiation factor 4E
VFHKGQQLIVSYRIAIWTRSAPDLSHPDTEALKAKILAVGRFWKGDVLGYSDTNKLVAGGLQSDVTFESHKVSPAHSHFTRFADVQDSEKKGNKNKVTV